MKRALGYRERGHVGMALGTNSALSLGPVVLAGQPGIASTINSALALGRVQKLVAGIAQTFDVASSTRPTFFGNVGMATAADSGLALTMLLKRSPGIAVQTNTALPVGTSLGGSVGLATATNLAFARGSTITTHGAVDDTSGRPSLAGYTLKDFVADYGGNGNGVADNTTALQNAANAPSGTAVFFPTGTYNYNDGPLMSGKDNVLWYGNGYGHSILRCVSSGGLLSATVIYNSTNIKIVDLQVYSQNVAAMDPATLSNPGRNDNGDHQAFYIFNNLGPILVQNVYVKNTAGAGILAASSNNVTVTRCTAELTHADAFHYFSVNTGLMQYNLAKGGGDDAFASIGGYDGAQHNFLISILDNRAEDMWWGAGVSFEGTSGGEAKRNQIVRTGTCGIRIASQLDGGYNTGSVNTIQLEDNYLSDVVTRSALAGAHGAIFLYNSNPSHTISGITFKGNRIENARFATEAFRANAVDATRPISATLNFNTMIHTTGPMTTAYVKTASATLTKSGNTFNGVIAP